MARRKAGAVGREVHPGRGRKQKKTKTMNYQQSLDWAGRLGRNLRALEPRDIPRG